MLAAGTFWLWHAPGVYAAALTSTAVYWLMQLTLLASAIAPSSNSSASTGSVFQRPSHTSGPGAAPQYGIHCRACSMRAPVGLR